MPFSQGLTPKTIFFEITCRRSRPSPIIVDMEPVCPPAEPVLLNGCDVWAVDFYRSLGANPESAIGEFVKANRNLARSVTDTFIRKHPQFLHRIRELRSAADWALWRAAESLARRRPTIADLGAYLTTAIDRRVRECAKSKFFGEIGKKYKRSRRRSGIEYPHCPQCQADRRHERGNCPNCSAYLGDKHCSQKFLTKWQKLNADEQHGDAPDIEGGFDPEWIPRRYTNLQPYEPELIPATDIDERLRLVMEGVLACCATEEERQVVTLRARKMTDRAVARKLKVSESTVRNIRQRIKGIYSDGQERPAKFPPINEKGFDALWAILDVDIDVGKALKKDKQPRPVQTVNGPCSVFIIAGINVPDLNLSPAECAEFTAYEKRQKFWELHAQNFIRQLRQLAGRPLRELTAWTFRHAGELVSDQSAKGIFGWKNLLGMYFSPIKTVFGVRWKLDDISPKLNERRKGRRKIRFDAAQRMPRPRIIYHLMASEIIEESCHCPDNEIPLLSARPLMEERSKAYAEILPYCLDEVDRLIVRLRLLGATGWHIGYRLGLTLADVRDRCEKIAGRFHGSPLAAAA